MNKLLDYSPAGIEFDQVQQVVMKAHVKKISFGQLNNPDEKQTLACFGNYYQRDVLTHPGITDHANIGNFI